MIDLGALVPPERVTVDLPAANKRQVLEGLAGLAARATGREPGAILEALDGRERLGTTGLGQGIAIPHCRLPGVARPLGFFARLDRLVDFDALDGEPVDLVFLLLAPDAANAEHLKALARIARLLRGPELRDALRRAPTAAAAHALLVGGAAPPGSAPATGAAETGPGPVAGAA